jgi:hypothetical protein
MGSRVEPQVETLPVDDPSGLAEERLDTAAHEERLASLFRRWPALDDHETTELRRLWEERVLQAKAGSASPRRCEDPAPR